MADTTMQYNMVCFNHNSITVLKTFGKPNTTDYHSYLMS